jgi:hypothetical protein
MRYEIAAAGAISLALAACSGGEPNGVSGTGGAGAPIGAAGNIGINVGEADSGGIVLGASCAASEWEGEEVPADLYVMFDQSGSMATPTAMGTRLDAVRSAVADFLHDPDSSGLAVGIGYFGYMPIGHTSCQMADYRTPAVAIAPLPGNATALLDSLNAVSPVGETPTGPAIRGACSYAGEYQRSQPGHVVSLLLVTDGVPEAPVSSPACSPTLSDAVQAASECRAGTPAIRTYVLGVGPSLDNLKQITAAGGTDTTYLVEGGNVSAQVVAALNAIRLSAAIPCQLGIPSPVGGGTIDFNQVNVIYRAPSGQPSGLLGVGSATGCNSLDGGWYYDDPASPKKVVLCPSTCTLVEGASGGRLTFALGCRTLVR